MSESNIYRIVRPYSSVDNYDPNDHTEAEVKIGNVCTARYIAAPASNEAPIVRSWLATFAPASYVARGAHCESIAIRALVNQIQRDADALSQLASKLEEEGR